LTSLSNQPDGRCWGSPGSRPCRYLRQKLKINKQLADVTSSLVKVQWAVRPSSGPLVGNLQHLAEAH